MSWLFEPGGFELFVNRDELRSRPPARPPATAERDGVRYLAPEDTAAGGTWVAVDELGLALSLLNREWPDAGDEAERRRDPGRFTSRGALVRALAGAGSTEAAMARLAGHDLAPYQPFTLLALAPGEQPRLVWWDGDALSVSPAPPVPPLASSSPVPEVEAVRRTLWQETVGRVGDRVGGGTGRRRAAALAFHRSHRPARGASSPCMHRPEAATVSLCHIRVDDDRVSIAYAAGPPCRHRLGAPSTLARRGVRAPV